MSIQRTISTDAPRRPTRRPVTRSRDRSSGEAPKRASFAKRGERPARGKSPARGEGPRPAADPRAVIGRLRVPLIALAAVAVVVLALYAPLRSYYQAWRANTALQERESQASADTSELEGDINSLMSEEGIKDEARRHGYVEEGETHIVVKGGDEEGSGSDAPASDASSADPWYVSLGDFIFQYQG